MFMSILLIPEARDIRCSVELGESDIKHVPTSDYGSSAFRHKIGVINEGKCLKPLSLSCVAAQCGALRDPLRKGI